MLKLVLKMVNKVKFDREKVINKAGILFWQKGFSATSPRDLQPTVDMRPGSIYAAFGSKEGLYSEALKNYAEQLKTLLATHLSSSASILEGLHSFVQAVLEDSEPGCEICMLIKANAEFDHSQPLLKNLTNDLLQQFECYLTDIFDTAQKQNELATNHAPLEYARLFQIQFTGLRSYMHRSQSNTISNELVEMMFKLIKDF